MLTCSVQRNAAEEMIGTKLTAVKHFCEPKMPVDGNLTRPLSVKATCQGIGGVTTKRPLSPGRDTP